MKRELFLLLCLVIPLFCMAQRGMSVTYDYDEAGNRTTHKVLRLTPSPPAPPDTLPERHDELQVTSDIYFVEKIARVEMKIYPNPATEKITLAISNMEDLQAGILQLYSLSGQLLQTQPVYSATTEVLLAGLAKGAYILKVQINERTEDWKIIKN